MWKLCDEKKKNKFHLFQMWNGAVYCLCVPDMEQTERKGEKTMAAMSKAELNAYRALHDATECLADTWQPIQDAIASNSLTISFRDTMNKNLAKSILKKLDSIESAEKRLEKHGYERTWSDKAFQIVRHSVEVQLQRELNYWAQI